MQGRLIYMFIILYFWVWPKHQGGQGPHERESDNTRAIVLSLSFPCGQGPHGPKIASYNRQGCISIVKLFISFFAYRKEVDIYKCANLTLLLNGGRASTILGKKASYFKQLL